MSELGNLFEEPNETEGQNYSLLSKKQYCAKNMAYYVDSPADPRDASGLMGLKNQGATCYLNALIQTMFMSPELRRTIFSIDLYISVDDDQNYQKNPIFSAAKFKILFALQSLFAEMQGLQCRAVSTESMTKSFGWEGNEANEQHDVQEAQRVFFDVLDRALAGTQYHQHILQHYKGTLESYIQCLKCGYSSQRQEVFYDLNIQVKGQPDLEHSLESLVSPELMEGTNQYSCPHCNSKQDAHKGTRILRLPNVVTFSLNRYEYDQLTMQRKKINDDFHFNLELNCSKYVVASQQSENDKAMYDYELFAVMIHAGSAHGGHYHVYVRDCLGEAKWEDLMQGYLTHHNNTIEEAEQKKTIQEEEQEEEVKNNFASMTLKNEALKTGWFDLNDSMIKPIPVSQYYCLIYFRALC